MSRSTRNRKPSNTDIDTTVEVDNTNTDQEVTMQDTTTEAVETEAPEKSTLEQAAEAFTEAVVNPPKEEEPAKLFTPFEAARVVNDALAERNIIDPKTAKVKKIPGQMMYNYTTARLRSGDKPLIKAEFNATGKTVLDREDFDSWLARYLEKLTPKAEATEEAEVKES